MMFLLTCDKKLTKSQLSPTHASTKRKITDELKHVILGLFRGYFGLFRGIVAPTDFVRELNCDSHNALSTEDSDLHST